MMSLIFMLCGSWFGTMSSSKSCLGDFVDFKFLKSWSRCPCAVDTLLGRFFLISLAVMPGHDVKCLLFIALIDVDVTGLNKWLQNIVPIHFWCYLFG